ADGVEVELLHHLDVIEILLRNGGNRDVVDVHLVFLDEMNQQVQRPLEGVELHRVGVRRRFEVCGRAGNIVGHFESRIPTPESRPWGYRIFIASRTRSIVSTATFLARAEPSTRIS